ncbi:MAG: alpha/beta hydrolase [Steroidobacteraceae bacterium]
MNPRGRTLRVRMFTTSLVIVVVLVSFCGFLYVLQDSLVFFPRPNDPGLEREWQDRRIEIQTPEGTLVGWWARGAAPASGTVVLYFGGNAEDVLYTAESAKHFAAERMLLMNYRGYGLSPGKPSQAGLFEDALAIYDHVRATGISADRIVVMGRSLGSGVAAMLAANRPVRGVVLITPFDSLGAVAAHHYRGLPVSALLKHPFPSIAFARQAQVPALLLAAERDEIVPPVHAERLSQAWAGPHRLHVLTNVGHNDVEQDARYYVLINEFLRTGVDTQS